jgi:hypothetical protein
LKHLGSKTRVKDSNGRWSKTDVTFHDDMTLQELLIPFKVESAPRRFKGQKAMLLMSK